MNHRSLRGIVAAGLFLAIAGNAQICNNTVIFDGSKDIPYIAIEPSAVTRENLDSVIIDSGFHLREEVYMNEG